MVDTSNFLCITYLDADTEDSSNHVIMRRMTSQPTSYGEPYTLTVYSVKPYYTRVAVDKRRRYVRGRAY